MRSRAFSLPQSMGASTQSCQMWHVAAKAEPSTGKQPLSWG
jgi:hypothetical protein